jgi:hypothetical protein
MRQAPLFQSKQFSSKPIRGLVEVLPLIGEIRAQTFSMCSRLLGPGGAMNTPVIAYLFAVRLFAAVPFFNSGEHRQFGTEPRDGYEESKLSRPQEPTLARTVERQISLN